MYNLSTQCVCIYTAVYSQTLTAISIFKYVNMVCIIQVHMDGCGAGHGVGAALCWHETAHLGPNRPKLWVKSLMAL